MKTIENINDFEILNNIVRKTVFFIALKINIILYLFLVITSNLISLEETKSLLSFKTNIYLLVLFFVVLQILLSKFLFYLPNFDIDSECLIKRIEKCKNNVNIKNLCKQFLHCNFTRFNLYKFKKEFNNYLILKYKNDMIRAENNRIKQDKNSLAYKYFSK